MYYIWSFKVKHRIRLILISTFRLWLLPNKSRRLLRLNITIMFIWSFIIYYITIVNYWILWWTLLWILVYYHILLLPHYFYCFLSAFQIKFVKFIFFRDFFFVGQQILKFSSVCLLIPTFWTILIISSAINCLSNGRTYSLVFRCIFFFTFIFGG